MKALLLSGFLVLLAATAASARIAADLPWVCGPREVFKTCVSSTCAELKCGMEGMPEACTMDCASGCFCAPGFYLAADLPWVCGPREVFKTCVSSTCAELKCGMEGMPEACTMDCASGCFCAPGFYRRGHRECVPQSECQIEPLKPMPYA
ncbi:hypothetical protein ISCGN_021275 [Ixodes scapularis]